MDLDHVDKAIVENYRKLRTRIGVIALAFPVVLIAVGAGWGLGVQPTFSDYYFARDPVSERIDLFPVRLWFCGILFVVGIFLYKYQGFSENHCAGKVGLFRRTCGDYARMLFSFCMRGCGCGGHPAFPAPSILSRVSSSITRARSRRENAKLRL